MPRRLRLRLDTASHQDGFDLGGDTERLTVIVIIKRLDSEMIARQKKAALFFVPDGEGKHSPQMLHHALPIFPVGIEQNLGIGAGEEGIPFRLQMIAQFPVVVDFTIEGDAQLADTANPSTKQHLGGVPKRSLPDEILNRSKTGFSIPVREWMEERGDAQGQRGLRGWSLSVSEIEKINLMRKR